MHTRLISLAPIWGIADRAHRCRVSLLRFFFSLVVICPSTRSAITCLYVTGAVYLAHRVCPPASVGGIASLLLLSAYDCRMCFRLCDVHDRRFFLLSFLCSFWCSLVGANSCFGPVCTMFLCRALYYHLVSFEKWQHWMNEWINDKWIKKKMQKKSVAELPLHHLLNECQTNQLPWLFLQLHISSANYIL